MMLIISLNSAAPGSIWDAAKHAQPVEELLRLCKVKVVQSYSNFIPPKIVLVNMKKGLFVCSHPTQGTLPFAGIKKKYHLGKGLGHCRFS